MLKLFSLAHDFGVNLLATPPAAFAIEAVTPERAVFTHICCVLRHDCRVITRSCS